MIRIIRSIIDPESLKEIIKKNYSLQDVLVCSLLKGTGSNDIYQLSTRKNNYIIKIYSKRKCWSYTLQHYLFEAKLQKFLFENGISVPNPIENNSGELVSLINSPEYEKFYVIYSFVPGLSWDHKSSVDKRLEHLGESTAILHKTAKGFNFSGGSKRVLDLNFLLRMSHKHIVKRLNPESCNILAKLKAIFDHLETEAALLPIDKLKMGIIHGDMHAGNHLYHQKSSTISFLDFELCGHGYYLYELAALKWDLSLTHRKDFTLKALDSFLNGYFRIDNTVEFNMKHLDIFVKLRSYFILGSSFLFYPETPQRCDERIILKYLNYIQKL